MLRRIVPAVLATAVLATGLTACSSPGPIEVDRAGCTSPIGVGALSENTVVLGEFGTLPEVSIPKDTKATGIQRSIVDSSGVKKDAGLVDEGMIVGVNYGLYEQTTGELLEASPGFGKNDGSNIPMPVSEGSMNPVSEAVRCTAPGERVVLGMSQAIVESVFGVAFEDGMVAVIDVESVGGFTAEGKRRSLPSGYPAVVTDENGQPGVVLPPIDAPAGLNSAVRIEGTGNKVTAENSLYVNVLAVDWTGKQLSNTHVTGPDQLPSEADGEQMGAAYRSELTGVPVGSQVVVLEGGDAARVLVIDILAAF